ncbi:M36 family metallopeptidase [Natronosporangium hydrolyticum]|uniref:M36 family metallopeptidase n=1 Tax=Natronosporangium hydrolyticum TaxID=2811111 RepID=A0A895YR78_9ACTN|nr:M36 family metallopeptidase [Natronosporangium hydrolyticum]QSB16518.1 M36 family metallopeptidase [Natronosporangium hydrolyticum]
MDLPRPPFVARPAHRPHRPHRPWYVAILAIATSLALVLTPAGAHAGQPELDSDDGPADHQLPELDSRGDQSARTPAAAALAAADQLDATVRWNRFGTVASLTRPGEFLATGVGAAGPVEAARSWLRSQPELFAVTDATDLRLHAEIPLGSEAYAVTFQQYLGGRPVSPDGLVTVGLTGASDDGWRIAHTAGALVPAAPLPAAARLDARRALLAAAADVEAPLVAAATSFAGQQGGWQVLQVDGVGFEQLVRPVAFPLTTGEVRPAYETNFYDGERGYRHIVDAETGEVQFRESIVAELDDAAQWSVYPAHPPMTRLGQPPWGFPSADQRMRWCWQGQPGCDLLVGADATGVAWDVDARTGEPTHTTIGNAVEAAEWWTTSGGAPAGHRPVSPDRDYRFPWTNSWYESGCHSDNLTEGGNDIDASVTNLFAQNWRMHTWSYHRGFTEETWNAQEYNFGVNPAGEGDPVIARAQAGAESPGSRNNATMATRPDGTSSIMSMFLWQPAAGAFHGPCVVGDFDMSVIAHEYVHMIENRLIGKGSNRSGFHAGAMGESFADFIGQEYLNQYDLTPGGFSAWTTGAYATGNPLRGIRNYNMSFPPAGEFPRGGADVRVNTLQFGSMGYDIVGPQVHADSQIWSATNYDLRQLFLDRYPNQGAVRQAECADGRRPVGQCPGNHHWLQLVFDAMLLMPTAPTMLDARDAYLAADLLRFDGDNQDLLWRGFAQRGFGEHASVTGTQDGDPVPSFTSPLHEPATLHFEAIAKDAAGVPIEAEVFVGNYEARATPLQPTEQFIPQPAGYQFVARAEGHGHVRFLVDDLSPGEERTVTIHFPTNVAAEAQGATAAGDGERHAALLDDTEATNWESVTGPVGDAQVTVALAGEQSFTLAKASAMLLPGQHRFTGVRQFELYACTAGNPDNPTCDGASDAGWDRFLRSDRNAFPAPNPRPSSPDLILRSFEIPEISATHVKFVVVHNQCTGYRGYQGVQHADPAAPDPDCRSTAAGANEVRAASLQLLTSEPEVTGATLVD